ncbi:MAG TPA: PAS domain S-box protein [Pyrinomonadaceae bacterium]|nr:PAS domain S-box protein [Pyrinomonadaceae bacterium]
MMSEALFERSAPAAEEEFQRALLETLPQRVFFKDRDWAIVRVNAAFAADFSLTPEELIGKTDFDLFPPEHARKYRADDLRVMDTGRPVSSEEVNVSDGVRRIVEVTKTPVFNAAGEIIGVMGIFNDITGRKEAEDSLRESEHKYRSLFNQISDSIFIFDAETLLFLDCNERVQKSYGYAIDELRAMTPLDLHPPEELARVRANVRVCRHERAQTYTHMAKDGRRVAVEILTEEIEWGGRRAFLSIARDISERRRAEIEREAAEEKLRVFVAKLEISNHELQEFASVASHDLQEPLRKIQAFGDRLKSKCADALDDAGRDYLARMQHAARRMQTLINDLLTFSRVTTKAQPFVPLDFGVVVREVLFDLEVLVEQTNAEISVGDLPIVEADPLQMRQLLQNLLGNALKFHRPGVSPRVRIEGERFSQSDEKDAGHKDAGHMREACRISISDNGIGFDEKYLDRIFTVFQRLHGRHEYEGTGVGLAVCRRIAERHGGQITAHSRPGEGATFTVTLPAAHPTGETL